MKNGQLLKSDTQFSKNGSLTTDNHTHNRLGTTGTKVARPELVAAIANSVNEIPLTKTSCLVIGCGGSGCHAVSVAKSRNSDQERVKFLAIDTDAQTQRGVDTGVPFEDNEFMELDVSSVANLIDAPNAHQQVNRSLGLDDPKTAQFVKNLMDSGVEHAGQVKKFGAAAFSCNSDQIRRAIEDKFSELKALHAVVNMQLNSSNAVLRHRMIVYIVSSTGGGTGAGIYLQVAALVRDIAGQNVEIVVLAILPEVFEKELAGRPDEWARVQANSAQTLRESLAAQSGQLKSNRVMLGQHVDVPIPSGVFNQTLVAGRICANGTDLRSKIAALEAIGAYLASQVYSPLGEDAHAEFQNAATLLSVDPLTRRGRHLGSIGVQEIGLNTKRLAKNSASRAAFELLDHVVGALPELVADNRTAEFLCNPLPGRDTSMAADALVSTLVNVVPNVKQITRGLYRAISGAEKDYFKNKEFIVAAEPMIAAWAKVPAELTSKMFATGNDVLAAAAAELKNIRDGIVEEHGWQALGQFCKQFLGRLNPLVKEQQTLASQDASAAREALDSAKVAIAPVRNSMLTNKKAQDEVVRRLQLGISKKASAYARTLVIQMYNKLVEQAQTLERTANSVVAAVPARREVTQLKYDDSRSGRSLTTNIAVELDAATPELDDRLYETHRLTPIDWILRLRDKKSCSTATLLQAFCENSKFFEEVLSTFEHYFESRFKDQVNIVDIIVQRMRNPETCAQCRALLGHVVNNCQPMWQADSGQAGVTFADSLMIAIPKGSSRSAQAELRDALSSVARRELHPNAQYGCSIKFVETDDTQRITAVRTTHGACFHYLPSVHKLEAARARWLRSGGHSLSIFNDAISQRLETLVPLTHVEDVDLALALGVAFGWIAQRGTRWYYNLCKDVETGRLEAKLSSHWNGLAFRDGKRVTDSASLQAMIDAGRLQFQCSSYIDEADFLGEDMDEALAAMGQNLEMIERILEAYAQLRGIVGNTVAKDLQKYVGQLKATDASINANTMAIERMISYLEFHIEQVRAGR